MTCLIIYLLYEYLKLFQFNLKMFSYSANLVSCSVCPAGLAVVVVQLQSMWHNFPSTNLKNNTSLSPSLSPPPTLSSVPPLARGRGVIKTSSSLFEGRGRKAGVTWWSICQSLLCGAGWRWIDTTDEAVEDDEAKKTNGDLTAQLFMLTGK